ncbi:MAG: AAA family ATPase [Pyrinomonadaceae bacterium]|nr:AAA family ATPase [Pyrinomonadaceae bacterium]
MSEFSNPLAVQRLIGGTGESEGLLTAKVREQPFSVVLLDEFEKAHHSFFDLLLQILGEGRLTDSVGRVADFTNSIIVMTSNLGASEFQRGKSGFLHDKNQRQTAVKHFDSAVREFLRPEIYNRLDRIVPFAPLDEKTVAKIADLEIAKLKKRDGLRFRPIKLELDTNALNYLIETGYDIRYGARPLKRTIERELLAPLSAELNLRPTDEKITINCGLQDGKISLEFTGEDEPKKRSSASVVLASQAERIGNLRRKMQKFLASYKLTELSDEIYQVVRLEALQKRGKWVSEEDRLRIERKLKLQHFLDNLKEFGEKVNQNEDEILLEVYGKSVTKDAKHLPKIEQNEKLYWQNLFELLGLQYQKPNEITLTFFSENSSAMFRLVRLYLACLKEFNGKVKKVFVFTSNKQPDQKAEPKTLFDREVWRKEITDFDKFFNNSPSDVVGIFMQVEGNLALPRLGAENGVHNFQTGSKNDRVLAVSTEAEFEKFELSDDLIKRDSLKNQTERRIYDFTKLQVKDLVLKKTFTLEGVDLQDVFVKANQENLDKLAESLIM